MQDFSKIEQLKYKSESSSKQWEFKNKFHEVNLQQIFFIRVISIQLDRRSSDSESVRLHGVHSPLFELMTLMTLKPWWMLMWMSRLKQVVMRIIIVFRT